MLSAVYFLPACLCTCPVSGSVNACTSACTCPSETYTPSVYMCRGHTQPGAHGAQAVAHDATVQGRVSTSSGTSAAGGGTTWVLGNGKLKALDAGSG